MTDANTICDGPPNFFPLGQDGVLVRFGDGFAAQPDAARAFGAAVSGANLEGVSEVATSLASVLVRFTPWVISREDVIRRLQTVLEAPRKRGLADNPTRLWTIPASFGGDDGPQLNEAAALAGLSPEDAIADITATEVSVLAIGFAPGQPYLGHLHQGWDMPRQQALTRKVPAGSLVVALRQMVVFANPSPTGWRWIGSCAFAPFKTDRAEPFALRVGDRVRFAQTDAATISDLRVGQTDGLGGATCVVQP